MSERNLRRSNYIDHAASYGAIGTSQAEDLLKYPPLGSVPFEHESLLGSGEDRFVLSSALLMTWEAQKGAGVKVEIIEQGGQAHYAGVDLNNAESLFAGAQKEQYFAPDGTPYLSVGAVVKLTYANGFTREMRVISVLEEENSVGFVMGTTYEQEVIGEEFFRIELRKDKSVWAVVRGFYYPSESGVFGMRSKKRVKTLIAQMEDEIFALTPAGLAAVKKNPGN